MDLGHVQGGAARVQVTVPALHRGPSLEVHRNRLFLSTDLLFLRPEVASYGTRRDSE